jgi:hypothetical protein
MPRHARSRASSRASTRLPAATGAVADDVDAPGKATAGRIRDVETALSVPVSVNWFDVLDHLVHAP